MLSYTILFRIYGFCTEYHLDYEYVKNIKSYANRLFHSSSDRKIRAEHILNIFRNYYMDVNGSCFRKSKGVSNIIINHLGLKLSVSCNKYATINSKCSDNSDLI